MKSNKIEYFNEGDKSKLGSVFEKGLKTDDINDDPTLKKYNIEISQLTIKINQTTDKNERARLVKERENIQYNKSMYLLKLYLKKLLFYFFVFALFSFNLIVVAVSMSCSLGESFFKRVISGIFAFFFGIIYLVINYKYYKLRSNVSCVIQPNNPYAI